MDLTLYGTMSYTDSEGNRYITCPVGSPTLNESVGISEMNKQELNNLSKHQLIDLIDKMYSMNGMNKSLVDETLEIVQGGKYQVTPSQIASMHRDGYSLSQIREKLNEIYKRDNVRDEKTGNILEISLQTLIYKIRKYESVTGERVYKPDQKGRKKKIKEV